MNALVDTSALQVDDLDPVDLSLHRWDAPDYTAVFHERMRRLHNLRESADPAAAWAGLKAFYKDHPVEFINDWGMTVDPRNPEIGLPARVPFLLFPRQVEYINWLLARWKGREDGLTEKSRDMGVSWLCVAFAVWMFLFYKGVVVGFGSRKEEYVDKLGDPKSLFWKVREFIKQLPIELRPLGSGWDERKYAPSMRVLNPENESTIVGEAGDNIGRGNRTAIYFKDESAHYERPEAIDAALSQTSNCKIDVSSVNGAGNPFYQKRHGGEIDVFIFDWKQDPRKNEEWYEKQCRTLDKRIVAQEIDRNYEASVTDAYIDAERVNEAMSKGPADIRANGGLRVGVDVARFGDDKTAIVFRRGRVVLKVIRLSKSDIVQTAARVRSEVAAYGTKPEQIAVDTIGIGAGVADILRGLYPDVIDKKTDKRIKTVVDVNSSLRMANGTHYNLRAYMWAEMKEWLAGASLPKDHELKSDLTALRYGFKGGELLLESKDDAKRRGVKSPDAGDALALTFAEPTEVAPTGKPPNVEQYRPSDSSMGL